jgi:hypothetical protein
MIVIDLNQYTFIAEDTKKDAIIYMKKQKEPDRNSFLLNLCFKIIYNELSSEEIKQVEKTDLFKIIYPRNFELIVRDLTNGKIYYILEIPKEKFMFRLKEIF